MELIIRKEAQEQGLETYFTGRPCKRGNIAPRHTATKKCLCEDCRSARNASCRKWRAGNPEKQKQATDSWKRRNPEKQRAVWNRSEQSKKQRIETDPVYAEHRAQQSRDRSSNHFRKHYGINPEFTIKCKVNASDQKVRRRRARQAVDLMPAEHLQVRAIYKLRTLLSRATGVEYHVDHHIPLKEGGLHHPDNLWVITAEENLRKGAKLPA